MTPLYIINATTKFAQCWYKTVPSCAQCWPRETAVQKGWSLAPETQSNQVIRGVVKVQHVKLTIVHGGCILNHVFCRQNMLLAPSLSLTHTHYTHHIHTHHHTTYYYMSTNTHHAHQTPTHHATVLYQKWLFLSPASHRSQLFTRLLQITTYKADAAK